MIYSFQPLVADVVGVELRLRSEPAGELAHRERSARDERDTARPAIRQGFPFGMAIEQIIVDLHSREVASLVEALDHVEVVRRDAEKPNLALLLQRLERVEKCRPTF